jgi:zinc transporter, ZIP family
MASLWQPSRATRSLIQHFAAGVVLAALAVELLPEIEREHAPGMGVDRVICGRLPVYVWVKTVDYQIRTSNLAYTVINRS